MERQKSCYLFSIYCLVCLIPFSLRAQDTLHVLFLGNSYTYFNNLPQLVSDLSASAGKTLLYDSNTPGGYTLSGHLTDVTSLSKIRQGNWDYVILQEQSQLPTIDYYRYNSMYVAAQGLADSVHAYNPCAKLLTFMTWGRRFGGQQCDQNMTYCSPVFTDFNHMQDSLTSAYEEVSDLIQAKCAPVGVAWQNILNDTAIVLHNADNSHPAPEGSYVAACVFYDAIWGTPSTGLPFTGGLAASSAGYFQTMADLTYFNATSDWNKDVYTPRAEFTFLQQGSDVLLTNSSTGPLGLTFTWDFGDGSISTQTSPAHSYAMPGTYMVTLIANYCGNQDTTSKIIQYVPTGIHQSDTFSEDIIISPNPFSNELRLEYKKDMEPNSSWKLFDAYGRILKESETNGAFRSVIHTADLPVGAYYLIIRGEKTQCIKLLKVN